MSALHKLAELLLRHTHMFRTAFAICVRNICICAEVVENQRQRGPCPDHGMRSTASKNYLATNKTIDYRPFHLYQQLSMSPRTLSSLLQE